MSQEKVKNIIEAILMVSTKPLSIAALLSLFEAEQTLIPERDDIRTALEQLQQDYHDRGVELAETASGFSFQARDEYAAWVNHLFDERPPRYSRALLETLAIIAYRQPITRGEIEEIRGVSVSGTIIKTLFEREWIKGVGHRDVPGKPELLVTTRKFLDYFNLKKLSDLPALADIKDFDAINPDLFEALEEETKTNIEQTEAASAEHPTAMVDDEVTAVSEPEVEPEVEVEVETETEQDSPEEIEVVAEAPAEEALDADASELAEEVSEAEDEAPSEEGATVIPFSS